MACDHTEARPANPPAVADEIHSATDFEGLDSGADRSIGARLAAQAPKLRGFVGKVLRNDVRRKEGISDIVQDVLAQAVASLSTFRGKSDKSLLRWTLGIARNLVKKTHRKFRTDKRDVTREVPLHGDSGRPVMAVADRRSMTPLSNMVRAEELARVARIVSRLSEEEQEVIRLRMFENQAFADVGSALGCSVEAARKRFGRVIDRCSNMPDEPRHHESR